MVFSWECPKQMGKVCVTLEDFRELISMCLLVAEMGLQS